MTRVIFQIQILLCFFSIVWAWPVRQDQMYLAWTFLLNEIRQRKKKTLINWNSRGAEGLGCATSCQLSGVFVHKFPLHPKRQLMRVLCLDSVITIWPHFNTLPPSIPPPGWKSLVYMPLVSVMAFNGVYFDFLLGYTFSLAKLLLHFRGNQLSWLWIAKTENFCDPPAILILYKNKFSTITVKATAIYEKERWK